VQDATRATAYYVLCAFAASVSQSFAVLNPLLLHPVHLLGKHCGQLSSSLCRLCLPADQNIEDVMRRTKSKRKHKQDLQLDAAQQEAIRQQIAASMAKKAARVRFNCPACGVTLTRGDGVLTHMQRCCADLLPQQQQQQQQEQQQEPQQVRKMVAACNMCHM
jgi:predicted RNA-binding Zn-ribbon protein involved in translation (DUF1610 family)